MSPAGYSSSDGWKNSARLFFSVGPGFVRRQTTKKTTPAPIKDTRKPFSLCREALGNKTMALPPTIKNVRFIPAPTSVAAIAPTRVARLQ